MLKYFLPLIIVLSLSVYVSRQDKNIHETCRAMQKANQKIVASIIDHSGSPEGPTCNDPEDFSPLWYQFFRWPNGATACAVILTLLVIADQTRETARAARAAESAVRVENESVLTQKDTAQRQLRAYVCVERVKYKAGAAFVSFKNCGQTPAYQLRVSCCFHVDPNYPPSIDLGIIESFQGSESVLGPGVVEHWRATQATTGPLMIGDEVVTNQQVLYVFGEIRYCDAFKDRHFTRFRYILGGPSKAQLRPTQDWDGIEAWTLFPDTSGNEAD